MTALIVGMGADAVAIPYVKPEKMDKLHDLAMVKYQNGGPPLKLYKVRKSTGLIEAAINICLASSADKKIFLEEVNREECIIVNSWHPAASQLTWYNPMLERAIKGFH